MAKKATKAEGTRIVPSRRQGRLKRKQAADKTAGGIVLPDTAKDKPQKGEVVAVGDGHVRDDGTKVALSRQGRGQRDLSSSYAGDEIKVGEEELLLLREGDILATY